MAKKRSSDYWKKRFEQLERSSNAYGQQTYVQIEPAFTKAQRSIQTEIESWYARFAQNNGVTMQEARKMLSSKELAELKWDVQEYIKYGQQNALDGKWMKQLENASARFHISRLEALQLRTQQALEIAFGNELDAVDKMARHILTEDYYHSIFEVQKGFNIGWEIGQIDQKQLDKLVTRPWTTDGKNFSDRIWERKQQMIGQLHQELTRTVIQGKAPDEAIMQMQKFVDSKVKNAKAAASRLVMTEQAYFHSVSQQEAFDELDVEEFEIIATLDSHTSEICQEMDGQHFPMKEYEPGVTAPPFHPNCRSVTAPYFADNYGGERAARNADGETCYVPSDMKYSEWKKTFAKEQIKTVDDVDYKVLKFKKGAKGEQEYADYIKDALKKVNLSATEHAELWKIDGGYIQNSAGYKDINGYMRGMKSTLNNPKSKKTMDVLIDATTKNSLNENFVGYRKVEMSFVNEVMGLGIDINPLFDKRGHIETFKSVSSAEQLANAIKAIIGTDKAIISDKAVTSVSLCENLNAFSNRVFGFELLLPKGTVGLLTDNYPESEFIACPNTILEIIDVIVYNINDRYGKRPAVKMIAKIKQ